MRLNVKNGDCFTNFKEDEIKFAPTYKFDIQKDTYDTSRKKRKPAWCDRIVYKVDKNSKCEVEDYNSINDYKISDHKPVYGLYCINVNFPSFF